jgi:fructokinase
VHKIGIDLGGTKIEGVCIDENLNVVSKKRIPTMQQNGYDHIVRSIVSLIRDLAGSLECSVGVCTPGAISKKTGLIKNSNTQCLVGTPLKEDIERMLGTRISMDNDANCFAMAESTMGAAMGYGVVFGVIMGTGVGGGIIINGKIHHGRTNIAGEWGHHTLHQNGNRCYCGRRGCVETYISGPALERRWAELTGKKMQMLQIIQSIEGKEAQMWKDEFLDNFGISLANVIDILDPDAIVLGGGLSNIGFLYDEGRDAVYKNVFSDIVDTPILQNKLGDSAGMFGAAVL